MNHQTIRLATLVVVCITFLLVPAGAVSIGMIPSSITVQKGGTAEISLVLDEAVSGLAGYDLTIRFSNPSVAEISEVTYPSWAALSNTTRKNGGSVRISGVDLSRQVNPGMTAVPLATLKIRAISGGSSTISLESVNMHADGGAMIIPTLPSGLITVPGTPTPSGGGGGGGGGGSSVISIPQQQTVTTPSPSPTTTAIQVVTTIADQENVQAPLKTETSVPQQATAPVTAEPDGTGWGIPWLWILGGLIVIAAMVGGAIIAWRKELEED